jgi:ubiquinone/menaquinone biosynthesis C-methylase UbiE
MALPRSRAYNFVQSRTLNNLAKYMAGKHQLQIAQNSVKGINWFGKIVLDIGCSNGSLDSEILKLTKAKEIIGVDSDKERIIKAKKIKNKKLQFLLLDANNMKIFPDNSFDAVFSNMTFQQFDDFRLVLREVYRLLKPKGQAVINFNQEKKDILLEIDKLKARLFNTTRKIQKEKKISASKFRIEAKKIGFSKINILSKYDTYFFDSVDDLVGSFKDPSLSLEENIRLYQELREVLKKNKTKKGFEERWNMVFSRLIK